MAFPLHVGQRAEAVGDLLTFVAQDDRVGDVVGGRFDVGRPVPGLALACGLLGAHAVHGAPVRHRQQPCQRRAHVRVIVGRRSPYLQVDVLRGFLAVPGIAQHAGHQAEHPGAGEVIEGGKRVDIPLGHLAQQRCQIGGHER